MKKLLVIIFFIIPNFPVAQSIKPFTDYSMEELFTDEKANYRSKLISKTHEYINSIKVKATDTLIGHRQIYVASMGEGKTVVEKQRKSKAVDEIKKISEQILLELK